MNIPTVPPVGEALPQQHTRSPRQGPLRLYSTLTLVFLLAIVVQVFLAGAGIFASASWLSSHAQLGHLLPLIPLLMLILGLVGKLPRKVNWLTVLLFVLVYVQPWFIYISRGIGVPILSALHPVNVLAIFTLPLYLLYRSRLMLRMSKEEQH